MTSLQTKKGGTGGKEEDRQTILKQMKVRTKLKTDKSWIHQDSEDDKEKVTSPISPQLKALEGRKFMWSSTTPDSEPDNNSGTFTAKETITRTSSSPVQSSNRNSGVFTAKEIVTSSTSPPAQSSNRNSGVFTAKEIVTSSPSPTVQSSNKQFSYSSTDINTSSTGSKTSPPPSTSGNRPANSYIIRGQPVNAVSQVKTPTFFNGYQKSQVQARTTSLPRVPTATGYKMSTDEYKKLAPYNVRNKSSDLSDDDTPFTQQEQAKRTEQASSVLRNTTSKDRSYVISAAKRNSGIGTQDSGNPFLAKRIEIKDDEVDTSSKSQTLPKTLPSYSAEDANRVTERSSSPRMTSYSMTSSVDEKSSSLHPEAGKITIVRGESHNEGKDVSKPATQKESSTSIQTTRTESVPERSSSPRLTSYSMSSSATGRSSSVKPEVGKITVLREDSHTDSKDVSKPPTEKESSTTTRTDRVEVRDKKDEAQPTSLDAFLIEDANRFQSNWKANQNVQPTSQTSPARVEVRDKKKDEARLNSLDSYLFEDASRFENKWKTNQTVQPTVQTSPAKVEVGDKKDETGLKSLDSFLYSDPSRVEVKDKKKDEARLNSLDSYLFEDASRFENNFKANQSKPTTLQTSPARAPGRPESPKLTSWNTDSGYSTIRPEPGKITVLRQESEKMTPKPTEKTSTRTVTTNVESGSVDIPKLTSFADITEKGSSGIQAGPGKITVLRQESNQVPEVTSTTRTVETKAESTSPAPAPRLETKPKDTTSEKYTDLISWTDLDSSTENRHPTEKPAITPTPVPRNTNKDRPAQPSRSPEARHRVSESLDDPQLIHSRNQIPSSSENQNVKISIETLSDDPNVPPKIERVSSPRITSNSENRNVKISIETLPEQPQTTETHNTERSSSPRPTPRTREGTMNTTVSETRYRVPENLEDTMPQPSSNRSSSRTTVTTTTSRSTDPVYTEYLEDNNSRTTRTVSNSRDTYTTTTVETRYDDSSYGNASQYDPQSPSNKGVLFVKEYVNSRESLKSPTTAGSLPDYSGDSEMLSYSNNSSYLYSSAPRRADEGPCTYCGREIKDCAKIMLDHLNIYCHEYCFKCGICHKPMGDLVDSIFIHRDVVHCESCYEKLF